MLKNSFAIFTQHHPSTRAPSHSDLILVKRLSAVIAARSAALVAAAIYALWSLRRECASEVSCQTDVSRTEHELAHTVVAYNGGVIEMYPGYRDACQQFLDQLVNMHGEAGGGPKVELVAAAESSLLGAAISAACKLS